MDNIPTRQQMRNFPDEITFGELLGYLWRGKYITVATTLLCIIFAYSYISDAPIRYEAQITITEASSDLNNTGSSAGGSSVVSRIIGVVGASKGGNVELVVEMMSSLKVARLLDNKYGMVKRVFADQWDENKQQWKVPEPGLRQAAKVWFDIPYWVAPDVPKLAEYIKSNLLIEDVTDTGFKKIKFRHKDPAFAQEFLNIVFTETDDLVRKEKRKSLLAQKAFLEQSIEAENRMIFKQNLLNLLLNIEQRIMLISTDQPYLAQILDVPFVGDLPVEPRPNIVFFIAVVGGGGFGCTLSVCIGLLFYRKKEDDPDAPTA